MHRALQFLMRVLTLAALLIAPAFAAPPSIEQAPAFILMLDNTGGSAALEPAILAEVEKVVEQELRALPVGSMVHIFTVGDPKQIQEMHRERIQTRASANGVPVNLMVAKVKQYLRDFAARQHPQKSEKSALVLGWFQAAQLVNMKASAPNSIVFVTDGLETEAANCYRMATCNLPRARFTLPPDTRLHVLGFGLGQPSANVIALHEKWKAFFQQAGIADVRLWQAF